MGYCPVCNGLVQIKKNCPHCSELMKDNGRYMDYFDDYSAYLPIELTKQTDGIVDDGKNNNCPHILTCTSCQHDMIVLINEV
ncbi:hypothetical protein Bcell_1442 [Evansella cellulosilytica DSM 2522]|uniref:Uncharacterized protein n=1 Tax=Evansella cellulosilytica (strain ATCC 21833 / DSM 2522 / FERM P-1141 / JCM 9156 / N-4) TaxID=649639 RepID=E6TUE9_EVAC2|nr:hypothetical protein Bcell_1442 [Evansella cellulosilytica DSM 2522]